MAVNLKGPILPVPRVVRLGDNSTKLVPDDKVFPDGRSQRELIVSSIRNIMLTRKGERPHSDFGTDLDLLTFDPMDNDVAVLGTDMIRAAISQWEPRVEVVNIAYATNAERGNDTITWTITLREVENPAEPFEIQLNSLS